MEFCSHRWIACVFLLLVKNVTRKLLNDCRIIQKSYSQIEQNSGRKKQLTSTKSFGTVIRADFCNTDSARKRFYWHRYQLSLSDFSSMVEIFIFRPKIWDLFSFEVSDTCLNNMPIKAIFWLEKVKTSVLAKVWCIWIIRSLLI